MQSPNTDENSELSRESYRVSVVTAVFNDLKRLKETGSSILKQTYPVEWVVVDSDSGSETRNYLNNINLGKHSIKWLSEKDKGLYDGMNKGYDLATGDIILFLNAGDLLIDETIISKVVDSRNYDAWSWAVGLAVRTNENYEPQSVWEYYRPTLGGLALGTRTFCHQATFYSREIFDRVKPYKVENLAADHLLNVRIFKISRPKMLTFVTTLFVDGGISSRRPISAAFADLREIRIEENLLLLNSYILDYFLTKIMVLLVKIGGLTWRAMRFVSHKFVKEPARHLPIQSSLKKHLNLPIDHENRS